MENKTSKTFEIESAKLCSRGDSAISSEARPQPLAFSRALYFGECTGMEQPFDSASEKTPAGPAQHLTARPLLLEDKSGASVPLQALDGLRQLWAGSLSLSEPLLIYEKV